MRRAFLVGAIVAASVVLAGCPKKNKPPPVRELYMGPHVTCAVLESGAIRCQGRNADGELGPGAVGHGPNELPIHAPFSALRIGPRSVCVVAVSGSEATCSGKVDAEEEPSSRPACFLLAGGDVGCVTSRFPVPPKLEGIGKVVEVASGRAHVCLRFETKTVSCFGDNTNAQLANGTSAPSAVPVAVQGIFGAEQIVAAGDGTCARLSDKSVRCWGLNDDERLSVGRGAVLNVPAPVHF